MRGWSKMRDGRADLMEKATELQGRSLWADARRRFLSNKAAVSSLVILGLITILAIFAPMLTPHTTEDVYWEYIEVPPQLENKHWFGTNTLGQDMFALVFQGARVSLAIGVIATAVALCIGVVYGATAGYVGGRVDQVMMRFVDVLYALPLIFVIIILVSVFGRNIYLIFAAIGLVEWLTMARIVRGQTLSIKRKEYVEAAIASGATPLQVIWRHVVPNVVGPVIVFVTLLVPTTILIESFLSFLGLGVKAPLTSWGALISEGAKVQETAPWLMVIPATFLAVTVFCFNFIGDGLRDALDPKDR